jgi:hypothetical protein
MIINTTPLTQGCFYGCNKEGKYDADDTDNIDVDDDDDSSSASVNPDLAGDNSDDDDDQAVHHFVYSLPRKDGTMDKCSQTIAEVQKELTCKFCGKSDKFASSFPIPIQCCANEDRENEEFQSCHRSKKSCFVAMHVGCAIWGRDFNNNAYPNSRRIFFYPGQRKEGTPYSEGVTHAYCSFHAGELALAEAPGARTLRYPPNMPIAPLYDIPASTCTVKIISTNEGRESIHSKVRKQPSMKNYPVSKQKTAEKKFKVTKKSVAKKIQQSPSSNRLPKPDGAKTKKSNILQTYAKLIRTPEKRKLAPQESLVAEKRTKLSNLKPTSASIGNAQDGTRSETESTFNVSQKETLSTNYTPLQNPDTKDPPVTSSETVVASHSLRNKRPLRQIMRKVFKEIIQKEMTSDDHLETIFNRSQEKWNHKIHDMCDVDTFWKNVMGKLSRKLNYSCKPAVWPTQSHKDSLKWDEVKVLQIGIVPSSGE